MGAPYTGAQEVLLVGFTGHHLQVLCPTAQVSHHLTSTQTTMTFLRGAMTPLPTLNSQSQLGICAAQHTSNLGLCKVIHIGSM